MPYHKPNATNHLCVAVALHYAPSSSSNCTQFITTPPVFLVISTHNQSDKVISEIVLCLMVVFYTAAHVAHYIHFTFCFLILPRKPAHL